MKHGSEGIDRDQESEIRKMSMGQARELSRDLFDKASQRGATGVPVQIGDCHFIASAAHFLETAQDIEIVRRAEEVPFSTRYLKKVVSDAHDVGLLELTQEQAAGIQHFVDGNHILTGVSLDEEQCVLVSGFSEETHFGLSTTRYSMASHIGTTTVLPSVRPGNVETPLDDESDIFVEYPEESDNQLFGPGVPPDGSPTQKGTPVDPHGLSGGGIWLRVVKASPVCRSYLQLIGIQSLFYADSGLLRGVRIERWLDLVEKSYPQLHPEIEKIRARRIPLTPIGDRDLNGK